jgi:hypothetical protein
VEIVNFEWFECCLLNFIYSMISNVPLSFSNELIGHHAMNHGDMDIGSWVDELQLTGDF